MKKTKDEIREILLEQMCDFAQDIQECRESPYTCYYNIFFIGGYCPLPFKPSVSDKMLFNEMINKIIDITKEEVNKNQGRCANEMGLNVLSKYYYPYYSWCDERELKKAREIK